MFKGTSASAGIGIGKAVIVEEAELVITRNEVADAEAEIQRFKGALEKTIAATQKMADDLASRVGEKEAEIMQGHMMLLSDPMLTGETVSLLLKMCAICMQICLRLWETN